MLSSSAELSDPLSSGRCAWLFTPQITLPILDGGRNRANLDLGLARKDVAVAEYERTIQTAFREVSERCGGKRPHSRRWREPRQKRCGLSEARYRSGTDDPPALSGCPAQRLRQSDGAGRGRDAAKDRVRYAVPGGGRRGDGDELVSPYGVPGAWQ